jgi:hypothetical protein
MAKTTLLKTAAAMANVLKLFTVRSSSSVILRRSVNAGLGEKVPPCSSRQSNSTITSSGAPMMADMAPSGFRPDDSSCPATASNCGSRRVQVRDLGWPVRPRDGGRHVRRIGPIISAGSGEIPQLHAVLQKAPSVRAGGVFVRNRTIDPKAFECGIVGDGSAGLLPLAHALPVQGGRARRLLSTR